MQTQTITLKIEYNETLGLYEATSQEHETIIGDGDSIGAAIANFGELLELAMDDTDSETN